MSGRRSPRSADSPSTKRGQEITVEFTLLGQSFVGLNGGSRFSPTEAVSFQVFTDTQEETDRYWNAIVGNGGAESMCSWCKDRWGFSWQIVPRALMAGMTDPDPAAAKRVMEAMMTMRKIDIAQDRSWRAPGRRRMRKIIGGTFISLDGVIQAPGGPTEDPTGDFVHGGWMFPVADAQVGTAVGEFFSRPYDLLLGRRTYDIFAAYWPYVEGEGADPGRGVHRSKQICSHDDAERPLPWANSHRMRGMEDVEIAQAGRWPSDLLIQGSSTIYPALLAAGLLDRLVLYTFPICTWERQAPVRRGYSVRNAEAGQSPSIVRRRHHRDIRACGSGRNGVIRRNRERTRSRAATTHTGRHMVIQLFGHPFSSYTWKAVDSVLRERHCIRIPDGRSRACWRTAPNSRAGRRWASSRCWSKAKCIGIRGDCDHRVSRSGPSRADEADSRQS